MSAVPVKSILKNIRNNNIKKFRLARIAERFVKGPTLWERYTTRWTKQSKSECSVVRAIHAGFIEATMEVARKKAWDLLQNMKKSKGLVFKQVNELPTSQQNKPRKSGRISVR